MSRVLNNWLQTYSKYTERTESAPIFHTWVGISLISSALRKKTHLKLGRLKVFPNLYILLIAEPGIAKKSQAINYGLQILSSLDHIFTSADAITREAMIQDLEACATEEQMPDGVTFTHSSLSVISKEFESFLGQKIENTKMLVMLTDLYDAHEIPWRYRTKKSGSNVVPSVFLNILAATTPESFASCFPSAAIGGGLSSRLVYVWSNFPGKKEAFPPWTKEMVKMKEDLIRDLSIISRITGPYDFSPDARAYWQKWYDDYDFLSKKRLCKDPVFNGWYSRKPTTLLKVALAVAASYTSERILQLHHIQEAFSYLEAVEGTMGKTFSAVGRSEITADVDLVNRIVQSHELIEEKALMQLAWRDIDAKKFENVIMTAMRSGNVERKYKNPSTGEKGIWYLWRGAAE